MNGHSAQLMKSVGTGGAVALAAFYFIFQILIDVGMVKSAAGPVATPASYQKVAAQVDDLYEWHRVTDQDGVKLWYVPRSMTAAIDDQTEVLRGLQVMISAQTDLLARMERRDERRDRAQR